MEWARRLTLRHHQYFTVNNPGGIVTVFPFLSFVASGTVGTPSPNGLRAVVFSTLRALVPETARIRHCL